MLELKQLDPDWAVVLGPKTIKMRYAFTDADGEEVRLQVPFKNSTSITLEQVKHVRNFDWWKSSSLDLYLCNLTPHVSPDTLGNPAKHRAQVWQASDKED